MPTDYGGVACPKSRSVRDKRAATHAKAQAWQRVRRAVLVRDGWRCRVCHELGGVDVHHIKFRSAGRKDSTANLACLCRQEHSEIHAYRMSLTGDANQKLTLTRIGHAKTTKV